MNEQVDGWEGSGRRNGRRAGLGMSLLLLLPGFPASLGVELLKRVLNHPNLPSFLSPQISFLLNRRWGAPAQLSSAPPHYLLRAVHLGLYSRLQFPLPGRWILARCVWRITRLDEYIFMCKWPIILHSLKSNLRFQKRKFTSPKYIDVGSQADSAGNSSSSLSELAASFEVLS